MHGKKAGDTMSPMDTLSRIWSSALILLFVLDPFGNIPMLLAILKDFNADKQRKIIIREVLVALVVMVVFLFFGRGILAVFGLESGVIRIAGGTVLFVIGLRMVFPDDKGSLYQSRGEPFIVPIAIPLIAGPSALATLILMSESHSISSLISFGALMVAWFITAALLILAPAIYRILGERGLAAMERLMGMLLLMLSVQMFIDGLRALGVVPALG